MNRKRWIIIGIVGALLVSMPLSAAMHLRNRRAAADTDLLGLTRKAHAIRAELELTAEQVIALRTIALGVWDDNRTHRKIVRANLAEAADLLLSDPGATAAAEAVLARNDAAKQELRRRRLEGISEGLSVLTPEQRDRLALRLHERLAGVPFD